MRTLIPARQRLVTDFPGGVAGIPSQHGALPFADAAARVLFLGGRDGLPYRRVWLELPGDLPGLPGLLAAHLPACGGVIITYPDQEPFAHLSAPIYDSEGRVFAREDELVYHAGLLPCSPTDSIGAAAWVASKLTSGPTIPEVVCGDVPSRLRFEMKADWLKRAEPESGCDPSRFQMAGLTIDAFWQTLDFPQPCHYDQIRDAHMAWELSRISEGRKPALAIMGAAHEQGIRRHLGEGSGRPVKREGDPEPVLEFVSLSPGLMHSLGWMEMPFLADLFVSSLLEMTPDSAAQEGFNHRAALDCLIRETIRRHGPVSPRSLIVFTRMMNETLTLRGSWMVESVEELSELGEACVSRKFGAALRETASHASPRLDATDPAKPGALFMSSLNGLLFRLSGGKLCLVSLPEPREGKPGKKRHLPPESAGQFGISEEERKEKVNIWSGLPARSENLHRKRVNRHARQLAHRLLAAEEARRNQSWKSVPYEGSLARGIDIRGTMRDRARGNPRALRVRQRIRRDPEGVPPCRGQCPVVYVFDSVMAASGASPSGTQSGSFVFRNSSVTVAAYWYKGKKRRPHPDIMVREMAVYANLFVTEEHEYDEVKCRQWIEANIPPECICRKAPWNEPELAPFRGTMLSLALAWAVRYARHHCVVVSESHLDLPGAVQEYALQRAVKILPVSAAAIGMDHFDRLRFDTQVPARQNLWDGPEEWTERFIPPVPGEE